MKRPTLKARARAYALRNDSPYAPRGRKAAERAWLAGHRVGRGDRRGAAGALAHVLAHTRVQAAEIRRLETYCVRLMAHPKGRWMVAGDL